MDIVILPMLVMVTAIPTPVMHILPPTTQTIMAIHRMVRVTITAIIAHPTAMVMVRVIMENDTSRVNTIL